MNIDFDDNRTMPDNTQWMRASSEDYLDDCQIYNFVKAAEAAYDTTESNHVDSVTPYLEINEVISFLIDFLSSLAKKKKKKIASLLRHFDKYESRMKWWIINKFHCKRIYRIFAYVLISMEFMVAEAMLRSLFQCFSL